MNLYRQLLLVLLLLLGTSLSCQAAAPVWKVSKGGNELYLGGTIHLLGQADYPLPAAFDQAYTQAAELVLETDLDQVQKPAFQQEMLQQMQLPKGQTLQSLLQPATFRAVAAFAASRHLPLKNLQHFKPALLTLTLTAVELQRLGLAGTGVDLFFQRRAKADHKPLGELESAEAQLAFLAGMGAGREDAMISHALQDLEELPKTLGELKIAWRSGDTAAMEQIALAPWRQEFPAIYRQLLVERNRAWLPEIETLLKTPPAELVLVGTLHLVGKDGLLQQLAKHGYRIEQL